MAKNGVDPRKNRLKKNLGRPQCRPPAVRLTADRYNRGELQNEETVPQFVD